MSNVTSLDYDDIRSSFVDFLKQDPYYKDFNFEATNISKILNMLAYDTMYNGYFIKMLLDESMPDSAKTMTALIAHANNKNYLAKFITCAKANISISANIESDYNTLPYIKISRGQSFKALDKNKKIIYFVSAYDNVLSYNDKTKTYDSKSSIMLFQGQWKTVTYTVSELYQKYKINDTYCDPDTIKIRIKSNKQSSSNTEYIRNLNFYNTSYNDLKFYITASTSGNYQIHFGQDKFGREPKLGEVIEISYLKTSGSVANDSKDFEIIVSKNKDTSVRDINYYDQKLIFVNTLSASAGGADAQSEEDLRFSIINHSRLLGRAITDEDIKTVILTEYRDIESINVWNGADSIDTKAYGKTYISIKPKSGDNITYTGKEVILNFLTNKYNVLSRNDILFINPDFIDILLTIKFKINTSVTSATDVEMKSSISEAIYDYNTKELSKFNNGYIDSDLISYVKSVVPGLKSIFSQRLLQKVLDLNYSSGEFTINFGNPINYITTNTFLYGTVNVYYKSFDNDIYIVNSNDNNKISKIGTIDKSNGKIIINIPQYTNTETINIIADPFYPDVNTLENNIVRIKTITAEEL